MKKQLIMSLAVLTSVAAACGKSERGHDLVEGAGGNDAESTGGKSAESGGAHMGGESGGRVAGSGGGSGGRSPASGGIGEGGEASGGEGAASSGGADGGSGGSLGKECSSPDGCEADACSRATCEAGVCGSVPVFCEPGASASCLAQSLVPSEPSCVAPIMGSIEFGDYTACSGNADECTNGGVGCDVVLSLGDVRVESELARSVRITKYEAALTQLAVSGTVTVEPSLAVDPFSCEFSIALPQDPPVLVVATVTTDSSLTSCESSEKVTEVDVDLDLSALTFSLSGSGSCRLLTAVAEPAWETTRTSIEERIVQSLTESLLSYGDCQACSGDCDGLSCAPPE